MLVDDMKRWRPNHLGDLGCEAQWFSLFYWVRLHFNGYESNTVQLIFPSALNLSLMYHHWNQHFCQGYTGNHCHWKLYFYILKPDLQTFMSFSSFLAIFPLRSEYKLVAFFFWLQNEKKRKLSPWINSPYWGIHPFNWLD